MKYSCRRPVMRPFPLAGFREIALWRSSETTARPRTARRGRCRRPERRRTRAARRNASRGRPPRAPALAQHVPLRPAWRPCARARRRRSRDDLQTLPAGHVLAHHVDVVEAAFDQIEHRGVAAAPGASVPRSGRLSASPDAPWPRRSPRSAACRGRQLRHGVTRSNAGPLMQSACTSLRSCPARSRWPASPGALEREPALAVADIEQHAALARLQHRLA